MGGGLGVCSRPLSERAGGLQILIQIQILILILILIQILLSSVSGIIQEGSLRV